MAHRAPFHLSRRYSPQIEAQLPRFFFHFHGETVVRDEGGEALAGNDEAMRAARQIAHEVRGTGLNGSLSVETEHGFIVGEIPIGLVHPAGVSGKYRRHTSLN